MIFPKNDELIAFLRDNNYPASYNDGLRKYLIDLTGRSPTSSINDLIRDWEVNFGGSLLPLSVEGLFNPGSSGAWFTADDKSLLWTDLAKTTNVTTDGDLIAVQDSVDVGAAIRHTRTQATEADRPVYKERADGVGYIDYSGDKTWAIPGSDSTMKYLHDGTGSTFVSFIEKSQASASTIVSSGLDSSEIGFRQWLFSDGRLFHTIYKGSAPSAASASILNASLSTPIKMFAGTYKDTGTDPVSYLYHDLAVDISTSDRINTPSTSDSTTELTWTAGSNHIEYTTLIIDKVLTQSQIKNLYAQLKPLAFYEIPATIDYGLICIGQSNQSGRGDMYTPAAENKQVGVYTYSKAQEFNLATIPEHSMQNTTIVTQQRELSSTPAHGTAMRAAKNINTASGDDIIILPLGVGGTSIAQWDTPATITDNTTMYGFFKYQYDAIKDIITTPVILMNGHEQTADDIGSGDVDFTNGGVGTEYIDEMVAFVNHFEEDITETTDIPIIQVQLPTRASQSPANIIGYGAESQRQLEGIITNFHLVTTFDQPKQDTAHFTRAGYDVIATRIALAFREHVLSESVNGTGPRFVSITQTDTDEITIVFDKDIESVTGDFEDLFRVHDNGVEQTISSVVRAATTTNITITLDSAISGPSTVSYGYVPIPFADTLTEIIKDSDGMPHPMFGPIAVTIP